MPNPLLEETLLRACALSFKEGMSAPIVKAYGEGNLAQKIIEIARSNNVEIREGESVDLLKQLSSIPVNKEIPPELYLAVARIFAYLYGKKTENLRK